MSGLIEADIGSNSHRSSDRFRLRMALDLSGAAIWSSGALQVAIALSLDGAYAPMILGQADHVEIDPIRGEVEVEGRDLTALLIEARTQETFENLTSSDVATMLATRHGLTPNVTPTSALIGRNFQSQHARTTLDQHGRFTTEWDLLVRLADQEVFDVWVDQQVLNFVPAAPGRTVALTPADCMSLRLERKPGLQGDLSVVVKSWDCRGESSISQTAALGGASAGAADYVIVRPNVTADVAHGIAQRLLGEMAQHAICIDIDMPGELVMQPRMGLLLANTGTAFDGMYVISDVDRRISVRHGFTQHVRARTPAWIVSSI